MRGVLIAVVCLALAGCAAPPRLALPPQPVTVAARDGVLPPARLHTEVVVRAYLEDDEGRRREVGNADCVLETAAYETQFRSPARVVVPFWGWGSPPLEVACRADGLEGEARRGLVRRWADSYPWPRHRAWDPWYTDPWWPHPRRGSRVTIGVEIGGPVWGGPVWGRGRPVVYYPDVEVVMR